MAELNASLFCEHSSGLVAIDRGRANFLLTEWGHYLGPCDRPFGQEAWCLYVGGRAVSVAVSASTVSSTAAGYSRGEVVELARLCSAPDATWATRPMLRLWREVAAPAWSYWPVQAAVAYSQSSRHEGAIYRFDGWECVNDAAGSSGGGTWSTKREDGHMAKGRKRLWVWRYDNDAIPPQNDAVPLHNDAVPQPDSTVHTGRVGDGR